MRKIIALLFIWGAAHGGAEAANPSVKFVTVDGAASQLRADFNQAKGKVRLLFVVDPICPGCLRGLDDVNRDLLEHSRDPRLETFVVHVPVLKPPPTAADVPPAAELLKNSNVRHYWDPSGNFGRALSEGVDLKNGSKSVYAWDVWLIYGPDAVWQGTLPPKPLLLMHQLRALEGSKQFPRLDSEIFSKEVQKVIATLPPVSKQ
jgi:hypothetical protein